MSVFFRPWLPWVFAALLIVAALALRWPGIDRKVWNLDEGSTLTMAEIVRHGGVLYRDAADNRTPLVPYLKAAVLAGAGDWNMRAVHIAVALMIGLTAVGIWRTMCAAGEPATGAWGAGYFLLLGFVMPGPVDVMAAHTGWFLVFFSAWGMWAFIQALPRGSTVWGAGAGVLFALATLAKQPGLLDWGACLVLCALMVLAVPARRRAVVGVAASLVAGWAIVLAGTWAYFAAHEAWDDFLRYAWDYNTKLYVPEVPLLQRLWSIRVPFVQLWESAPLALFLGAAAAVWLLARAVPALVRRTERFPLAEWLILGWSASGLASTMLSGRDFGHYTIQTMPGLALGCAWITVRLLAVTSGWPRVRRWTVVGLLVLVPLSIAQLAVRRSLALEPDDGMIVQVGAAIRERTRPEDRIFVWGYVPELHLFAERLPNTRFVYSVYLTGMIPWTNLDPLKNTDYAIVPGAWEAFWSDFEARPPEMIVDTRIARGFSKYPLRRQERLWSLIESDYAEVQASAMNPLGFNLFQRVTRPPENMEPGRAGEVALSVPSGTLRLQATATTGTLHLDVYLDGRPFRRLANPAGAGLEASFVLPADLSPGPHQLLAVARRPEGDRHASYELEIGTAPTASRSGPQGPPLVFEDGIELPALEVSALSDAFMPYRPDGDLWEAHAPSRLVYRRPPELTEIEITYGLRPESYERDSAQKTDGVDVVVLFEPETGRPIQLLRRELRPISSGVDQGEQTIRLTIPGHQPGRLILLMTEGPQSNPAFDWAYWKHLRARRSGLAIRTPQGWIAPEKLEAGLGISRIEFHAQPVMMVHAPARLTYPAPPTGGRLNGRFGLLDESWSGNGRSEGAVFEVLHINAAGQTRPLWQHTLRPFDNPADRGAHDFSVELPAETGAQLVLVTRPANPQNNAFNFTFWHDLAIALPEPARR